MSVIFFNLTYVTGNKNTANKIIFDNIPEKP